MIAEIDEFSDANVGYGIVSSEQKISDLDRYIKSTAKIPLLTLDEERSLAERLRESNDIAAAERMVLSHLRLVVSTARNYLGFGLPHSDLIQEGNVGLMKAVKRFDERKGYRLVTYALPWIKAEIQQYCLKNYRMAKIATTKPQQKLFFNLRRHKIDNKPLTPLQIQGLADQLKVPERDVVEMEVRLCGGDIPIDPQGDGEDPLMAPISYLQTIASEPTYVMEQDRSHSLHSDGLTAALGALDARSRRIIETRWLQNDDESTLTLQELATEFGVSAERVRQIEVAAMKKMKTSLNAYM